MLYVALGRNVGDVPMSTQAWEQFRLDVIHEIFEGGLYVEPDTVAFGESRYGAMKEDTCVLVWFDTTQDLSGDTKCFLEEVAKRYGQECIAYTVADTRYIMGAG